VQEAPLAGREEQYWNGLPQQYPGCDGQTMYRGAPAPSDPSQQRATPVWPDPRPIYEALLKAACAVPSIPVEPAPFQDTPFRGSTKDLFLPSVVSVAASGGSAAAAAFAIVMAAGYYAGLTGAVAVLVQTPPNVGAYVTLQSYQVSRSTRAVFRKFGVWVDSLAGYRALRFRLVINGGVALDEEQIDFANTDNEMPVFVNLNAEDTVQIQARNLDLNSAYLVETRLSGWTYPVIRGDDSDRTTLLRGDPGQTGCGSWETGTLGCGPGS